MKRAASMLLIAAACHPKHGAKPDAAPLDMPDAAVSGCPGATPMTSTATLVISNTTQLLDVTEGGLEPLEIPNQGGMVFYLGARMQTASPTLTITSDLRDPTTQGVLSVDRRPMMMTPTSGGWAEPQGDPQMTMGNLSVCPDFVETFAMNNGPKFLIEVAIDDGDTRLACLAAHVIPDCASNSQCVTYCMPH